MNRANRTRKAFPTISDFSRRFNVDAVIHQSSIPELIESRYPTLLELSLAYGDIPTQDYVYGMLSNVAAYAGGTGMMTENQRRSCANLIITGYHYLTSMELIIFFQMFKRGEFGRFYGSQDPTVILESLKKFIAYRNNILSQIENNRNILQAQQAANNPEAMSRSEWEEIKMLTLMYQMPTRWNNYLKDI